MNRNLAIVLALTLGASALLACSSGASDDGSATGAEALGSPCKLSVTHDSYDGPNYWGTITIKNSGGSAATGFAVDFDVPSGATCTSDAVPSGAKLAASGSHCTFTWASAKLAAGASKTFNYSTDSADFSAASHVVASSASCSSGGGSSSGGSGSSGGGSGSSSGGSSGGKTITGVYVTWYGFNDNSCQVESQHDCNTIAFPKSDGWPVKHDIATEGRGTYADPITFATAANDTGGNAEFTPGTIIYVPEVRKYFVMEDQCFECTQEWNAKRSYHVDLWMGPSFGSSNAPLMSCEDQLTLGSTYHGTGTIIVSPPSDLPVDTNPLFTNDTCTAHTY